MKSYEKNCIDEEDGVPVPNLFLDNMYLFSSSEGYVITVILRETLGRNREWCRISFSEISETTGLTKRTIQKSIAKLVDRGFVLRKDGGKRMMYRYKFNLERLEEEEESKKQKAKSNK